MHCCKINIYIFCEPRVPPAMLLWACQAMLLANAAWDLGSCLAIWYSFCVKDVQALVAEGEPEAPDWRRAACLSVAEMHTAMWASKGDAANHAACMLMGWWVLTLGVMRVYAGLDRAAMALAAYSYAMEGLFFLAEAFKSTMHAKKSCYVSVFCFACLGVCVAAAR